MLKMEKELMIDNVECLVNCLRKDLKAHDNKTLIDDIEIIEWWLKQLKEKAKIQDI